MSNNDNTFIQEIPNNLWNLKVHMRTMDLKTKFRITIHF